MVGVIAMFYFNWRRFFADCIHALVPGRNVHLRINGHRARVLVMFFLCMAWMGGSGRLGLLLDELLFPWYRRTRVRAPLFIIGNFRSGSTLLHRMLAASSGYTAMKTWEIYFAPSIAQRKFWRGLWIVDRWFGGRLRRAILEAQDRQLSQVQMHRVRLEEPEEDEGLFLYLWDSLFNWFFVPRDAETNPYWRFDEAVPAWRRRAAMRFYAHVLRRHLALAGERLVYVSKSPSFTARIDSLLEEFPDARVIELVRHPYDCVVSNAGWFSFAWHFFASPPERFPFLETIINMTKEWYLRPRKLADRLPESRYALLRFEELVDEPTVALPRVLKRLGLPLGDDLWSDLERLEARPRASRTHDHTLEEIGMTRSQASEVYRDVLARLGYEP